MVWYFEKLQVSVACYLLLEVFASAMPYRDSLRYDPVSLKDALMNPFDATVSGSYLRPGACLEAAVRVADKLLLGEHLEKAWQFVRQGCELHYRPSGSR